MTLKKNILFISLLCILSAGNPAEKKETLIKSGNPSEWEGMVKINTEITHSGKGSFELYGKYPTEVISKQMIPIDMNKSYIMSCKLRSLDSQFPASAFFGLRMYDENKRQIYWNNEAVIPATETTLTTDAKEGTKELSVVPNPLWLKSKRPAIAFNVQDAYEDLPNFEVSPEIAKISDEEDEYKITLKTPLKKSYPAGTKIRLHSTYGAPFCWAARGWIPQEWKEFSHTMKGESEKGTPGDKFWKGTKYVRIFVWFGNYDKIPDEKARLLADDISLAAIENEK